jgi:AbrB family looped-hinge helix DNA binding protein
MAADLTATVSTKRQVILPKAIRDRLHWEAGTRLVVEETEQGVLLMPEREIFAPTRPEDVFSSLAYQGEPKSFEDMEAAIAAETRGRHARGRY